MKLDILKKILSKDEDSRPKPYCDKTAQTVTRSPAGGILTIGIGRNLEKGLSQDEIDHLFRNDIEEAIRGAAKIFGVSFLESLSETRQHGIICLIFNLGTEKLSTFHQTVPAIKDRNWSLVRQLLSKTKWARDVDPKQIDGKGRDDRIIGMICNEVYASEYEII